MSINTVTVFGASGRQGQEQLRELMTQGYWPRAASRQKDVLDAAGLEGVAVMAADYADPSSLDRVLENADAVFFQHPQVERPDRILAFATNVGQAAKRADVKRFIVNSTMWAPDEPCGNAMYDLELSIEDVFGDLGLPLVVFRPTIFMDNWATVFWKPMLVGEHKYRYPHRHDLPMSPISLADVAQFMVAGLQHDDLVGERLRIAGPETLTPLQMADILSEAIGGSPIEYEYQTTRDFSNFVYDIFGVGTGVDRETYVQYFDDYYTFNNDAPQQPFYYDVAPLLKRIPIRMETFREWAGKQDWTSLDAAVGSVSR
jgi:uncharacterized protein YbjT (DUF2867 family)